MIKNLKLSTKITFGFVILLCVSALLGFAGYRSLGKMMRFANLTEQGNALELQLQQCANLRRDFAIYGFMVREGEKEDASQKWYLAYDKMGAMMKDMINREGLQTTDVVLLENTDKLFPSYKDAFELMVKGYKGTNDSFVQWGNIGRQIAGSIEGSLNEVIYPAMEQAKQANSLADYEKWAKIENVLNTQVISNFLTLRVTATYFCKTELDKEWEAYNKQLVKIRDGIAAWKTLLHDSPQLQQTADSLAESIKQYSLAGEQFHAGVLMKRQADHDMAVTAGSIVTAIGQLRDSLNGQMKTVEARTNTFLLMCTGVSIAMGIVLAIVITRSIVKPIRQIIQELNESAGQILSASTQVSSASQSLAEGATEQAAGLEESSSSLEEMASMTRQNSDNARQANLLAQEAAKSAGEGSGSMQKLSSAIDQMRRSSDETAKIIKVIDEIAFQTNLLALNAAVEAARAGEAGKGFAVVSQEVRNLAVRSAEAAKNTAELIEQAVQNSKNGVEITTEVTRVFQDILGKVSKTTELVSEIAAANSEQSQGIDQVNTAVSQMDKVTQQNAASAEESASASEELNAQAEQMMSVVAHLVDLIEGAGRTRQTKPANNHPAAPRKHMAPSDKLYHDIAAAHGAKKDPLPMESDFKDFN